MLESPEPSLTQRARDVLERNRRGEWTCPSNPLYPHQWLWDSCFVAIGLASYDPTRAAGEVRSLLRGQWTNGMLPHMIFAPDTHDVGSVRIWRSHEHAGSPRDVATSCITQPPLPAVAAWHVARALPADERRAFLTEVHPRIVAYHHWLRTARDPHRRGLVTLIHPWECGLDTTPPWMRSLARMPLPWWLRTALRLHLARTIRSLRRDTRLLPAAQRTSDDDGLRMLVLAYRAKRHDFELARMPPRESVLIEDLAFNSLLAVANRALAEVADELGTPLDDELAEWAGRNRAALGELWDEPSGQYLSRDATSGELIEHPTIATFLPLWAGVPDRAQATRLLARLREYPGFWAPHPVPSVPTDVPEFEAERYWDGPTWVNMNWAIVRGVEAYGATDLAAELTRRTLELVAASGFAEYFSPLTGQGFGAQDFSWTAALTLDLISG